MRGGTLPPALLCAALAFALAFAPRHIVVPAILALLAGVGVGMLLPSRTAHPDWVFFGCWASVIVTALSIYLPAGPPAWLAVILAINAGLWAGATVSIAGAPVDLARALPVVLLVLPAQWLVGHRGAIALKVVSSWLIAVSILAATLPIVPTPGYMPDHME